MKPFAVSASQLRLFKLCPRSWYLKHVLRAPDDAGAGGLYLTRGNDFDRLVQLHVRDGVTGDSGAPKLANRQLAESRKHLPRQGDGFAVQFAYDVDAGGFRVKGKPDLRRPGFVQDTKTTSDRGPGVGKDRDSHTWSLTDAHTPGGNLRPLADDVQALLYAWCEFQLDHTLAQVECRWVYVSKADCPKSWVSECSLDRSDVEEWFDSFVRPTVAEMMRLVESSLPAEQVGGNPDSCARCFVRRACPGPFEGVNIYGIAAPAAERENQVAFDLSRLKQNPAAPAVTPPPAADLVTTLAASVAAVAINRPRTDAPPPPCYREQFDTEEEEALDVGIIEGPGAALLEETPPAPKARRGRPRKTESTSGAATAGDTATTAIVPDPKAPAGAQPSTPSTDTAPAVTPSETPSSVPAPPRSGSSAPTASGCAPSVGDLAAAVSALVTAVRELELNGRTGRHLDDAFILLSRGAS